MVCQYSRPGPVSSEKHETTSEAGGEGRGGNTLAVGTAMVVMGGYWTRPEQLAGSSRLAKPATSLRLRTLWRLYACDALLDVPQHVIQRGHNRQPVFVHQMIIVCTCTVCMQLPPSMPALFMPMC